MNEDDFEQMKYMSPDDILARYNTPEPVAPQKVVPVRDPSPQPAAASPPTAGSGDKTMRKAKALIIVNLVLGAILLMTYINTPTAPDVEGCKWTTHLPDGSASVISGNCTWLKCLQTSSINSMPNSSCGADTGTHEVTTVNTVYITNCTKTAPRTCPAIPPQKECPACPVCPTNPPFFNATTNITSCPAPVVCEAWNKSCVSADPDINQEALNWHPTDVSITPYLDGASDCKDYYLDLFQIKNRSRFKTGPSPNGGDYIIIKNYSTSQGVQGQDCFPVMNNGGNRGFWLDKWLNNTLRVNYTVLDSWGENITKFNLTSVNATRLWDWNQTDSDHLFAWKVK